MDMDDQTINRRHLLGGMAAAGAAGALMGMTPRATAAQAQPPAADTGEAQKPTITTVRDKVVYVTGGSSGIGLGIAQVLHEAGAKVVIGNLDDRQWADALQKFPPGDPRLMTVVHNVMDKDGWQRTADAIEKKFGPVHILVNNAGVGLAQSASQGTLNDWEWGMGVNLWGPIYGVNTFVPRMLAHGQGSHIVTTTSTSGIVPNPTTGIYSVTKMAAVALMEQLRSELRATTIGTTCFVPGQTTSNIGQSESHRPEELRNAAQAVAPRAAGAAGPPRPAPRPAPATPPTPYWTRPQDPVVVGRVLLDGILHNDLFVVLQPEWRPGVEARANALLESMVPLQPAPESIANAAPDRYLRTPIYAQEIAHRRATRRRTIAGT
jgi:NAD(P)-dependent dehydrogenase (short-subunit alcohol dehydrogenase family)